VKCLVALNTVGETLVQEQVVLDHVQQALLEYDAEVRRDLDSLSFRVPFGERLARIVAFRHRARWWPFDYIASGTLRMIRDGAQSRIEAELQPSSLLATIAIAFAAFCLILPFDNAWIRTTIGVSVGSMVFGLVAALGRWQFTSWLRATGESASNALE